MTLQQLRQVIAVADSGSMNEAAKRLYITQPSLSAAIKELEKEIGIEIFLRSNRGIVTTADGEEFLGYARQIVEQYQLMEDKYVNVGTRKKKFSVSMQHYTFAVEAFIHLAREYGMDTYEFAVKETKTMEIINDVRNQTSEIGVIYMNDFNSKVIGKILREDSLEFIPLFDCNIYVFMSKGNPLAGKDIIRMEELADYPCLSFDQGERNSFYFSEEVLSTYDYKRIIKCDDLATFLNLMVGLNGYTLCSGIICQELNGDEYTAVRLDTDEIMTIGYIKKKKIPLSGIGARYVAELQKYKAQAL